MSSTFLAATHFDVVAFAGFTVSVVGVVLAGVSIKIARETLEANKEGVEMAAGTPDVDAAADDEHLLVTNRGHHLHVREIYLLFTQDPEVPRADFVKAAQPLSNGGESLDEGQMMKIHLSTGHAACFAAHPKDAVIGIDYSILDGAKPRWHTQSVRHEEAA